MNQNQQRSSDSLRELRRVGGETGLNGFSGGVLCYFEVQHCHLRAGLDVQAPDGLHHRVEEALTCSGDAVAAQTKRSWDGDTGQ